MSDQLIIQNFITEIVDKDFADGNVQSIVTRFPPEPNGFLHIGHAKSICLNFGLVTQYNGSVKLRFDDTNPASEEQLYVDSIKKDIRWLGFNWDDECYTSDYFQQLYEWAIVLIKKGRAYVDDSSGETISAQKGTTIVAGTPSVYRNRSVEENLSLFRAMKEGEYKEGTKTLRAKIDMAHPNLLMRDPVLYRIKYVSHHRTGSQWNLYPMYDFAHGQSDAIEKVTHSLCTLEFSPHRELYDWFIKQLEVFPSRQYEFARLNMTHTVLSKRKLLQLVNERHVSGWDDPRMPTLSGMRRRGYTPKSIRAFCERVGVAKRDNLVDMGLLEFCVRDDLNKIAQRRMVVLDPLKVIIINYPEEKEEIVQSDSNPEDGKGMKRDLPFGREIYIERNDFMENPPRKYFRLALGQMVRLKSAYILCCKEVIKDEKGNVVAIHCDYLPNSKSGEDTSGVKVKGVIHWVHAKKFVPLEVRLFDRLFNAENMNAIDGEDVHYLNPHSKKVIAKAYAELSLQHAVHHDYFQFIRLGYFCLDKEASADSLVFNRTVTLRDTWSRQNT